MLQNLVELADSRRYSATVIDQLVQSNIKHCSAKYCRVKESMMLHKAVLCKAEPGAESGLALCIMNNC